MGISLVHRSEGLGSRAKGELGESIACRFLEGQRFQVLARNYRKKWGEIDIIALKDGQICFFEVKSVAHAYDPKLDRAHPPEENVHGFKQRQIRRMIQTWFAERGRAEGRGSFSFHVLSVFMDGRSRRARVKWLKDLIL